MVNSFTLRNAMAGIEPLNEEQNLKTITAGLNGRDGPYYKKINESPKMTVEQVPVRDSAFTAEVSYPTPMDTWNVRRMNSSMK